MSLEDVKRGQLPLITQLRSGSGTEGSDCGYSGDLNEIAEASNGRVGVDFPIPSYPDPQSPGSWVQYLRRITGNRTGPAMVRGDVYEALISQQIRQAFRSNGLPPPLVEYKYGIPFGDIRLFLSANRSHSVLLAINYGVAREDGCPVGSMSFSGGHIVMLTGAERRRVRQGKRYVKRWKTVMGDSLMDGRSMPGGGRYPKGWLITRLYAYRRAAGRFGTALDGTPRPIGENRAVAIFITRS
jgi:hypothetical protein